MAAPMKVRLQLVGDLVLGRAPTTTPRHGEPHYQNKIFAGKSPAEPLERCAAPNCALPGPIAPIARYASWSPSKGEQAQRASAECWWAVGAADRTRQEQFLVVDLLNPRGWSKLFFLVAFHVISS